MPVRRTVNLATLKDYVTIGQTAVTPEDVEIFAAGVNRLSPSSTVPPEILLVLMTAGALIAKVEAAIVAAAALDPVPADHPEGAPPPVPAWATELRRRIGIATAPPPSTGPVSSIEEMHHRARAAGLVIP